MSIVQELIGGQIPCELTGSLAGCRWGINMPNDDISEITSGASHDVPIQRLLQFYDAEADLGSFQGTLAIRVWQPIVFSLATGMLLYAHINGERLQLYYFPFDAIDNYRKLPDRIVFYFSTLSIGRLQNI
jgi:hypothetical protein